MTEKQIAAIEHEQQRLIWAYLKSYRRPRPTVQSKYRHGKAPMSRKGCSIGKSMTYAELQRRLKAS